MEIKTVKIKHPGKTGDYRIINEVDFDPALYELFTDAPVEANAVEANAVEANAVEANAVEAAPVEADKRQPPYSRGRR